MDLALAMVEADHGREAALAIARRFVLYLQRPGGQSQFSTPLWSGRPEREPLREVQAWAGEHLADDLGVPALASRAAMSERHFTRVFTRQVGTTPARWVESLRVEAARRRLETTTDGVEVVAAACGFGTAETMRRAFLRTIRTTPTDYRRRFRTRGAIA
jgi:transcriptional regulator GlxA family with amidase domain